MWHLAVKNAMYAYPLSTFMTQLAKERNDSKGSVTDSSQCKQVVDHMRANERCVMKEVDNAFYALLSNMESLITDCTGNSRRLLEDYVENY